MAEEEQWVHRGPEIPVPEPDKYIGQYLLESVRRHGNKTIMIDGLTGEAVSGAQLLARSVSVALELQQRGVRPGDVVSAALDNCFEVAYVFLGALYAGAVYAPFNPDLHADDVRHMLDVVRPKVVLCARRVAATARALLPPGGHVVEVRRGLPAWETFLRHPAARVAAFEAHGAADFDAPASIMPSSGTTGPPKGALTTQRGWSYFTRMFDMVAGAIAPTDRANSVSLHATCNFWVSGFITNVLTMISGSPMVIYPKFDVDQVLAGIEKYKITNIVLSPPHVAAIAKHPNVEKYDVSSIKEFIYSGAPLSPELRALAEKRLKKKLTPMYGQTEVVSIMPPIGLDINPNSVGMVMPNTQVKIVDPETGRTLGPNTEGEICVKSAMKFAGYYKNPQATADLFDKDGWLHTGDVGYFDEDGFFFICDRYKELIKYRGNQIIPADLESVLMAHPAVKDAAVVGIEHDDDQERAVGFVTLQEGHDVSKQELLRLLRDKLPEYKYLHGGLHVIKDIPRTATGKIQRRLLRQQARSLKSKL